jgi:hypothetical protein
MRTDVVEAIGSVAGSIVDNIEDDLRAELQALEANAEEVGEMARELARLKTQAVLIAAAGGDVSLVDDALASAWQSLKATASLEVANRIRGAINRTLSTVLRAAVTLL